MPAQPRTTRRLVIVLGDQLDLDSLALQDFSPEEDVIWMCEAAQESTHVPSSKHRIVMFLSAMRHFAMQLHDANWSVDYTLLDAPNHSGTLMGELKKALQKFKPQEMVITQPGEYRLLKGLEELSKATKTPLRVTPDSHFFTQPKDFELFANSRKQLRMEYWYRELREKFNILMQDGKPAGGQWNFDADNRKSFDKNGPIGVPTVAEFTPDEVTTEVIKLVNGYFKNHIGNLEIFSRPVTREHALVSLNLFIKERLPLFGDFEDAMWTNEPWLYHSHLSAALNLKLLNPREVLLAAEKAYESGHAPIESVEGFIRQILGWREYVRGMYWLKMPQYLELNHLNATHSLPGFYWTGDTEMVCLSQSIQQTIDHGYAHHIQRLMVLGLYTLMYGVNPLEVHEWFLSVFVDAVEWAELPNSLGMSQYADGGLMASKPYIASGKYIQRMSNYCKSCKFDPSISVGPKACPFTTLYWDFLIQHQNLLAKNPRMGMQVRNLARFDAEKVIAIKNAATQHRESVSKVNKSKNYS